MNISDKLEKLLSGSKDTDNLIAIDESVGYYSVITSDGNKKWSFIKMGSIYGENASSILFTSSMSYLSIPKTQKVSYYKESDDIVYDASVEPTAKGLIRISYNVDGNLLIDTYRIVSSHTSIGIVTI